MTGGPSDTSTVLDIYKLAVEMADRTSGRRQATNTFFVSIHSAIAALVGVLGTVHKPQGSNFDKTSLIALAVVGLVLSATWWTLLRYYRRLNRPKFIVINNIETQLPVKLYTDEWAELHPTPVDGQELSWWKKNAAHREASLVEQLVPFVFAVIYIVLAVKVGSA